MNGRVGAFAKTVLFLVAGFSFAGNLFAAPTHLLRTNEWALISLPADPGPSGNVSAIFGDDLPVANYGAAGSWVIYEFNTAANAYAELAPGSLLKPPQVIGWFS